MPGPLEGLKVLEVANWVAAPSACAIMADMGTEVIKIEHPETGDPVGKTGAGILQSGCRAGLGQSGQTIF